MIIKSSVAHLYRWFLFLLLLTPACAPLEPVSLPPEYTPQPAEDSVWKSNGVDRSTNRQILLNYGPDALRWRLRAIDSAVESIDLQSFLWELDTVGSYMLTHLTAAADRGVSVRILVDDSLFVHEDRQFLTLAQHPNIEYRIYNPFKRRSGGVVTRELLNLTEFHRLDHRMHNKSMVVDNSVAIIGGRNLADEYFGFSENANFRDLELLIGGPAVQEVSTAFDDYWNDRWSFPIEMIFTEDPSPELLEKARQISRDVDFYEQESFEEMHLKWHDLFNSAYQGDLVLYVDSPPETRPETPEEAPVQVADEIVDIVANAQREILVLSAYLIPTARIENLVKQTVARGVKVRILTNSISSNNHLAAHSAYRNHINTLIDNGAELHEIRTDAKERHRYILQPIDRKSLALHAKALVIDNDKVFIGSANLDPRSLRINTEMGFLVTSETFNEAVRRAVEVDFTTENAWHLELRKNGHIYWISDDETRASQPASSFMQRIEDWFISFLPIENEL